MRSEPMARGVDIEVPVLEKGDRLRVYLPNDGGTLELTIDDEAFGLCVHADEGSILVRPCVANEIRIGVSSR